MFLDITKLYDSQLYVNTYNYNFNLKFMQTFDGVSDGVKSINFADESEGVNEQYGKSEQFDKFEQLPP